MHQLRRILIPADFSDYSGSVVDYACGWAADTGSWKTQLHLIHVVAMGQHDDAIRGKVEQLGQLVDAKTELEYETVREVLVGEPSQAITKYACDHKVDLIVMGTHGRTGLSHFALGSVAERVIRNAVCPVLVIGPRDQDQNVSLAAGADAIGKALGERFSASHEDGISAMHNALHDAFGLHTATCIRLVELLQQNEWISWQEGEPGEWSVGEGIEFVEVQAPRLTDAPGNQAADLIQRARRLRATDIHLDPAEQDELVVRLRIDGKLEEYCRLDNVVGEHLVNQLKTMADLDIAQPFRPQEGRVRLPSQLSDLEVRLTSARVAAGDAIALRIFDGSNIFLKLGSLGLGEVASQAVDTMLQFGEGLVLATGPTGSGKTTTVYSMLANLGSVACNLVSIEDPVEFAVPFVRQMNVDTKHGVTMTSGLRTILRMDPDVVFLGEIRDPEAAQIAMQAASSGRYVLSTLHTRDVASTVTALRDMSISDRSIAGNVSGIINQRLVRRLCPNCRESLSPTDGQIERFQRAGVSPPAEVFVPHGCDLCRDTGYRGRIGIFEVARIEPELAAAISSGEGETQLRDLLRSQGAHSLLTDALTKAAQGITSVDEALGARWSG